MSDTDRLVYNKLVDKDDSSLSAIEKADSINVNATDSLEITDSIKEVKNLPASMPLEVIKRDTFRQATAYYYDSLITKLTIKEKDQIFREALSYARSTRTYVSNSLQSLDSKVKRLRRFEIEKQRKFTIAFSCFVFLLIGAPLGAIIRKGGLGLPLVISTLFFIFYYIISLIGEKTVRESYLPDYQGEL